MKPTNTCRNIVCHKLGWFPVVSPFWFFPKIIVTSPPFLFITTALLCLICSGCRTPEISQPITNKPVGMEGSADIEWMEVSEDINQQDTSNLAHKLAAAANADATGIKKVISGNINGNFNSSLDDIISTQAKVNKKYKVSEQLFEKAATYRMVVYHLENEIREKILTDPDALKKAQLQLVQLAEDFGKIEQESSKQFEVVESTPTLNLMDGGFLHVIGKMLMTSPGRYELAEDLFVGDCVMQKGSVVIFNSDGTGTFTFYVKTNHTTNRDIWHQSWILEDGQTIGRFDSPPLYEGQSFLKWEGTFTFKGSPPSGRLVWDCGC